MLALHRMRVARALLLLRENRARCLRRSYQVVASSGVGHGGTAECPDAMFTLAQASEAGMMNGVVRREKGAARTGPARAGDESSPLCSEAEARVSTYKKVLVVPGAKKQRGMGPLALATVTDREARVTCVLYVVDIRAGTTEGGLLGGNTGKRRAHGSARPFPCWHDVCFLRRTPAAFGPFCARGHPRSIPSAALRQAGRVADPLCAGSEGGEAEEELQHASPARP